MKYTTLFAIGLFLTMSANKCKNDEHGADKMDMTSIASTKWELRSLSGVPINLPEGKDRPWLKLAGDELEGFGGCNRMMGGVALDGEKLSFSNVGSTKMYCADVQRTEDAFKQVLGKVDSYKMEDGLLKLMGGGIELAELKGM